MASAFGATLSEVWAEMPTGKQLEGQLREWGMWDPKLSETKLQERFARFSGVTFGIAPPDVWNDLRADLLKWEQNFACR